MKLKDKVVLVTGSSSGIGKSIAIEFAKSGANVVLTYLSNFEKGVEVFKECEKYSNVLMIKMDVTSVVSIKTGLDLIIKKFNRIDILINNAGVLVSKYFVEQSLDDLEKQVEINLIGTIRVTKLVFPYLEKSEESMIINISSMSGKYTHARHSAYGASKFGVRGFTKALADELPSNIKIYCVNPDLTATPMTNYRGVSPDEVARKVVELGKGIIEKKSGEDLDFD